MLSTATPETETAIACGRSILRDGARICEASYSNDAESEHECDNTGEWCTKLTVDVQERQRRDCKIDRCTHRDEDGNDESYTLMYVEQEVYKANKEEYEGNVQRH